MPNFTDCDTGDECLIHPETVCFIGRGCHRTADLPPQRGAHILRAAGVLEGRTALVRTFVEPDDPREQEVEWRLMRRCED